MTHGEASLVHNLTMRRPTLAFVAILSTSLIAESILADVRNVPMERLVANLTRMTKEKPDDLEVCVNLARVYAMAYAQKTNRIPAVGGEPWFDPYGIDIEHEQFKVKSTRDRETQSAAVANLRRAIAVSRGAAS